MAFSFLHSKQSKQSTETGPAMMTADWENFFIECVCAGVFVLDSFVAVNMCSTLLLRNKQIFELSMCIWRFTVWQYGDGPSVLSQIRIGHTEVVC